MKKKIFLSIIKPLRIAFFAGVLFLLQSCSEQVEPAKGVKLSALFSDNMVLQQGQKIPVWGKAVPGGEVTVEFNGQRKSTKVKKDSTWIIRLDSCNYGGPFELKVLSSDTIVFKNVMVGEVWVCSGQSNMTMPLTGWWKEKDYTEAVKNANYSDIRLFTVNRRMIPLPLEKGDYKGWDVCSPETVKDFSALAYFFGLELYKKLKVPVGLIHSSWGGTSIRSWMPVEYVKKVKEIKIDAEMVNLKIKNKDEFRDFYRQRSDRWKKLIDSLAPEKELTRDAVNFNDANWKTMELPTFWEDKGLDVDGVVWFRRSFNIQDSLAGKEFTLKLGRIQNHDVTYVNGVCVGASNENNEKRVYRIPDGVIKKGRNVIAIQVYNYGYGSKGGFGGTKEDMVLEQNNKKVVDLSGEWKYKFILDKSKTPIRVVYEPTELQNHSGVLFKSMIKPLIPYAIKGVIWYQGENNRGNPGLYSKMFPQIIGVWREKWGEGDFPFLFVQLANFLERKAEPSESKWAEMREVQSRGLQVPNTGMAVAVDTGKGDDIHPKNKDILGYRLALNALHVAYGQDVPCTGPLFEKAEINGNKVKVVFSGVAGKLVTKDGKAPKSFAIAGSDKKFYWAKAKITGDNSIVIWSDKVPEPVYVRYAWADNPEINLYDEAGLPAVPFRTDPAEYH